MFFFQDGGIFFLWALPEQYCRTDLFVLKYIIQPCIYIATE